MSIVMKLCCPPANCLRFKEFQLDDPEVWNDPSNDRQAGYRSLLH